MADDTRVGHRDAVRARRDALARARHLLRVLELQLGGARARRRDRHGAAPPGRRARARARPARARARRSGAPAICLRSGSRPGTGPAGEGFTAEVPLADGGDFAALGGLYSTVRDLARWSGVFLDAEPPRDAPEGAPVSRATLREMQRARSAFAPGVEWPSLAEPPGVIAGGYGYGLMIWHERDGQRHVGHPGGLPGYGTLMRWVPELGPERDPARQRHLRASARCRCAARSRWSRARPRCRSASSAPTRACWPRAMRSTASSRAGTTTRPRACSRPTSTSTSPLAERRAELEALAERHGALARDGEFEPEDALRGRWRLRGERGHVDLDITMAPTVPPLVQTLGVESVLPPAGLLATLATAAVDVVREPRLEALGALLSPARRRCGDAARLPGRRGALRPVRRPRAGRGRRRDDDDAAPPERSRRGRPRARARRRQRAPGARRAAPRCALDLVRTPSGVAALGDARHHADGARAHRHRRRGRVRDR